MRYPRETHYCVMRVSLRPWCITHYRNSVGLISTRCGKLMDRPPQSLPAPSTLSPRCAARCGVAAALSGAMSLPMEIVPLYGRAVEVLAATRGESTKDNALSCWNAKQVFAAVFSGKSRAPMRRTILRVIKSSHLRVCFYLHRHAR